VQSAHALIDFQHKYPDVSKSWNEDSNYLVMLSVKSKDKLIQLTEKLTSENITYLEFFEPDIGNELTAIAIEPSKRARKICSSLPLLLRKLTDISKKRIK